MRLSYAIVLLAAALTACSPKKQEGVVKYKGAAPNTSLQKAKGENRELSTFCPKCGRSVDPTVTACPDKKNCETFISWTGPYPCGSCKSTGRCSACYWMEQPDGKCYNCRNSGQAGQRIYLGRSVDCSDCKGKGVCPICDGKMKCDYCDGTGKITYEMVKERVRRPKTDEEETKPAPKTEEKKTEVKPSEEKK